MASVSVATFNVNCVCEESSNNALLVASTIADCGSDIVCLQESNPKWEAFLSGRDDLHRIYPHVKFHSSDWNKWAGFAVFSRFPIKTFEVIKETERVWYPAGLVTVEVPCPGKDMSTSSTSTTTSTASTTTTTTTSCCLLQLLIVHLRAPLKFKYPGRYWWGGHADWIGGYFSKTVKSKRLDELQTFTSSLRPGLPTIILGDFNERRNDSGCLKYLECRGYGNTPKRNEGCCWYRPRNSWKVQIFGCLTLLSFDYDHIVYSKDDLEPIDNGHARVHENCGSDHCLVSAEFRFKKF